MGALQLKQREVGAPERLGHLLYAAFEVLPLLLLLRGLLLPRLHLVLLQPLALVSNSNSNSNIVTVIAIVSS